VLLYKSAERVFLDATSRASWAGGSHLPRHNDEAQHPCRACRPWLCIRITMNLPTSMSLLRSLRRAVPPPRLCANYLRHGSTVSIPNKEQGIKRVIFSGIQPTGVPHLGNYLGALRQWVKLQDNASPDTTLLFSIVDLHAITIKLDPAELARWRKEMLASLLAVGLDPKRCIIFAQSSVKQHAELMWILSCGASMGYLGRMTQWKVGTML
jgi:tryptophanyl-tRNA synthetase